MSTATAKIIPPAGPRLSQLEAELQQHLNLAQQHYEEALARLEADAPGARTLFHRSHAEMGAALACQGQLHAYLLGAVLRQADYLRQQLDEVLHLLNSRRDDLQ